MFLKPREFAVLGNPVEHSLSPIIHQQFAQQFDHAITYSRQRLEVETFVPYVRDFFAADGAELAAGVELVPSEVKRRV